MKNLELAVALATRPRLALEQLGLKPRFLFPMLVVLIGTAVVVFWFYATVDFGWLLDQILNGKSGVSRLSAEQQARSARFMTKPVLMYSAVFGGMLWLLILRTVNAGWYALAGKVANVQLSFRQWFALVWWSGLPLMLSVLVAVALMLMSETSQIEAGAIAPLSLNELFTHRDMTTRGYAFLTSLTVLHPFTWILEVIAVRVWSRRTWLFSSLFVALPVVLAWGGWAWFALG